VEIIWRRVALNDLEGIRRYIAHENPAAGARVRAAIRNAAEQLADHPHLGRPGRVEGTRELVIAGTPFIVVYRVLNEDSVGDPRRATVAGAPLIKSALSPTPFELWDEEDLAARADRLEIGGLVDRAVDCDDGFFFAVVAQAGVELVHRLDDAAQVPGLDLKFAHPAGVAAAEPCGEDDPGSHYLSPPG
jgi:addiction module RelE/StbE family toxin